MFFCFPNIETIENETSKDTDDIMTALDDSETSSSIVVMSPPPPPPPMMEDIEAPLTVETDADDTSEAGTSVSNMDSLSFGKSKEEPPFGLEKVLRSISPLGFVVFAGLIFVFTKLALFPDLPSSLEEGVVNVVDQENPSEGILEQTSNLFKGLVLREDGSSQIQILHPRVILAVPAMVISTIHSFIQQLIGGATHNFAGGAFRRRNGPGVRGGKKQIAARGEEPGQAQKPEGEKKRGFTPGGIIRRLGGRPRPRKAHVNL